VGVTPSVPEKANSGVRARVPAARKLLEADDQPTLLREVQHYLHYITICTDICCVVSMSVGLGFGESAVTKSLKLLLLVELLYC